MDFAQSNAYARSILTAPWFDARVHTVLDPNTTHIAPAYRYSGDPSSSMLEDWDAFCTLQWPQIYSVADSLFFTTTHGFAITPHWSGQKLLIPWIVWKLSQTPKQDLLRFMGVPSWYGALDTGISVPKLEFSGRNPRWRSVSVRVRMGGHFWDKRMLSPNAYYRNDQDKVRFEFWLLEYERAYKWYEEEIGRLRGKRQER